MDGKVDVIRKITMEKDKNFLIFTNNLFPYKISYDLNSGKYYKIDNNNNSKENYTKESFRKPTLEEVSAYCQERKNGIDAEQFIDYYESKGWMIGKNKMKSWTKITIVI